VTPPRLEEQRPFAPPLLRQQTAAGVRSTGAAATIHTVVQLIQLWVLSRLLLPEDFGLVGMTMVIVGFAQSFSDAGITNAVVQRQNLSRDQLSSLYWLNQLTGIGVCLIVLASTPLIVWFFREPRLTGLVALSAVGLVIVPLGQQFQALLQKDLRFGAIARVEVVASLAGATTAVLTAVQGAGAFALVWGYLAFTGTQAVLFLVIGLREWRLNLRFRLEDVREVVGFGAYQMGERTLNFFTARVDHLLIGRLLGAEPLGYYTLAFQLAMHPAMLMNTVVTRVAFPVFARVQHDAARLRSAYPLLVRTLNSVNAPAMIGLAAVAPVLIPAFFGSEWLPSVPLLQALALLALNRSIGNPMGSLILSRGRVDLAFRWNFGLFVITPFAVFVGIHLWGALGAVLGLLSIQVGSWIPSYRILVRPIAGPCGRAYLAALLIPLALALVMGIAVAGVALLGVSGPSGVAILVGTGILCYVLLLRFIDRQFFFELKGLVFS
jgi:lipopolysaccharide exporter